MAQEIFKSAHPVLLANMNKGTVLPLSVAVHQAGGYASLCSWTYEDNLQFMQSDLEKFISITGSTQINLSFESSLIHEPKKVLDMIKTFNIPTIEVIYGVHPSSVDWLSMDKTELDNKIRAALAPIHDMGVKIFKRIFEPHTPEQMQHHFLDGLLIKGADSAGVGNPKYTVKEFFIKQKKLTPDAYLVPYGGVGTAAQVKEYIDLGAETVGIGTLFAASQESMLKHETKLAMVSANSKDLGTFSIPKDYDNDQKRQLGLKFGEFQEPDNFNHTKSLISGIWKKNAQKGHVFAGHGIDHITGIQSCDTIIKNLTAGM